MLYGRGTKQRVNWLGEDEKRILIIRRLHCKQCDRIHHELPDCIVPYKRYGASIIKDIVIENTQTQDIHCSTETIKRIRDWWAVVYPYFLNILLTLVEKYGVEFGIPPAFREIVRAVANSNNWVFAHQLCTRSAMRPG
jgi:hypothetical protein